MITPSLFCFETRHPESGALLEVEAEHFPRRCGSRDREGVPLEPDEAEEILILAVRTPDGRPVPFGDFEQSLVEEAFDLFENR